MLFRFSLYGFLKNQQYYEPFFILAFLEKGLTFFQIGLLIGFRELCVNCLEIPSGSIADLHGRRRVMILSFIGYILSFMVFGLASDIYWLAFAMFLFAIGEACRTGTHKAMIFDWLRAQNRLSEKTKVYGFTRSWSKFGSAISVLIGVALVFKTGSYSTIFLWSIVPYAMGIINFMGYPAWLDNPKGEPLSLGSIFRHLWETLKEVRRLPALRRIYSESMGFEVTYDIGKQYLQPILKHAALAAPVLLWLDDQRKTAVLVGVVYFVLELLSGVASRHAHRICERAGGEEAAARVLWKLHLVGFIGLGACILAQWYLAAALWFVLLAVLQNLWRPALMTRIDDHSSSDRGATLLSVESQLKSVSIMVAAPCMGFLADKFGFWPVAVFGVLVAVLALSTHKPKAVPVVALAD